MNERIENAFNLFDNGFNCAQSVLVSFCDELNLDKETVLKLSSGFGAGMGRKQEVCGALSGGILAIGAKYGNGSSGTKENIEIIYSKTRELIDSFTEVNGSHLCRELLDGCDLTTEAGQKEFKDLDLKNKVCKRCISTVVSELENILAS